MGCCMQLYNDKQGRHVVKRHSDPQVWTTQLVINMYVSVVGPTESNQKKEGSHLGVREQHAEVPNLGGS